MSKVLQERGIGSLPGLTEPNPRDHVKSISTGKADSTRIRHIGSCQYAVSDSQYSNLFSETVPFLIDYMVTAVIGWRHMKIREENLVFKSIKPATSIIRRVYVLKEGTDLDSKTEFIGATFNESFDPHYGNYIELNDLDMPLEPRMDQDNEFEPTFDFVN
ncbi:hypothetical protein Tco_1476612 [Tanacetum coccineum]